MDDVVMDPVRDDPAVPPHAEGGAAPDTARAITTTSATGRTIGAPPSRWRGGPWSTAVAGAVALWALSRALVTAVAVVTLHTARGSFLGGHSFADLLLQWDAVHFALIARQGYFPGALHDPGLPAFFPGYPALARLAAWVLTPFGSAAATDRGLLVVSALGAVVAAVFVWRIAAQRGGERAGLGAASLLLFGPYALFLHADYSESTFLAFATASWYAATRRRWLLAGVLCAGASATRVNGLFLLAALVVLYVVLRRRDGEPVVSWRVSRLSVGVLGTLVYFVYLWARTGRVLEWSYAQRVGWGRSMRWPWDSLEYTWFLVHDHPVPSARIQSLFDIGFAGLAVIALVWFLARRSWPAAVYVGLTVLSLVTSISFVSLARNTTLLFPVPVALARGAERSLVGRALWTAVLVVGVVLLAFNTHQFVLGAWAD